MLSFSGPNNLCSASEHNDNKRVRQTVIQDPTNGIQNYGPESSGKVVSSVVPSFQADNQLQSNVMAKSSARSDGELFVTPPVYLLLILFTSVKTALFTIIVLLKSTNTII